MNAHEDKLGIGPCEPLLSSGNTRKRPRDHDTHGVNDNPSIERHVSKAKSCIQCRQQKIKCNVVKDPFAACSNCSRLNKDCEIDDNFKRIAKRDQIETLRSQVHDLRIQLEAEKLRNARLNDAHRYPDNLETSLTQDSMPSQELEEIMVPGEDITSLFHLCYTINRRNSFFKEYHPLCPILDPLKSPQDYFRISPLLGWTIVIISARRCSSSDPQLLEKLEKPYHSLIWTHIAEMPQKIHTVKTLALLCTWPLVKRYAPVNVGFENQISSSRLGLSELDPTFMLSGIMLQIALQTGLHRPPYVQDFAKSGQNVSQAEIDDRHLTWIICNIVAQSVAITNGHPSRLVKNWSKSPSIPNMASLPISIEHRCKITVFEEKMTQMLYEDSKPNAVSADTQEPTTKYEILNADLLQLDSLSVEFSSYNNLSFLGAKLHYQCHAFRQHKTSPTRTASLINVYEAAMVFIQAILDYGMHSSSILEYCTDYILRTLISASCVLLKILNSPLAVNLDATQGTLLFKACILAINSANVRDNDFPARVAKAQTRMWRAAGAGFDNRTNALRQKSLNGTDLLDMKLRSRMCVSHVLDCMWGWRRAIAQQSQNGKTDNTIMVITETSDPIHTVSAQDMTLSLDDMDLFNSLDWTLDEDFSSFTPQ